MFVRLTFFKLAPGKSREVRKIYHEQIMPLVKKQKGNLSARLLEPTNRADDFISITEWKTRADAEAFGNSGKYEKLLAHLEPFLTKEHVLKNYLVEEVRVSTDSL